MLSLYNGVEIPELGLGAKAVETEEECAREYEFYRYAIEKAAYCLIHLQLIVGTMKHLVRLFLIVVKEKK